MNVSATIEPAIDLSHAPIVQIGLVVENSVRTANSYARLFGLGPWVFSDDTVEETILHGRKLEEPTGWFRANVANFPNVQLELIAPLWGPGSHIDFLRSRGEGVHHISFGLLERYDDALAAWQQRGIELEMHGVIGGCITASYVDTAKELGTFLEIARPMAPDDVPTLGQWGMTAQPGEPVVNLADRAVRQVGIVVRDAELAMRHYQDLLGVGPWTITGGAADSDAQVQPQLETWKGADSDPDRSATQAAIWTLHGVPMLQSEIRLKVAMCDWNGLQIKLIEPLDKAGIYWEFLNVRGPGVHHLSFGHVDDYDALLGAFESAGIGTEMTGPAADGGRFALLATARDLGVCFQIAHLPQGGELLV